MDQKPYHYDGSIQTDYTNEVAGTNEPFEMTDEMRINIGRNPYSLDNE